MKFGELFSSIENHLILSYQNGIFENEDSKSVNLLGEINLPGGMNLSSDIRNNVNIQPIKNDNKITLNNTMIIEQGNNGCGC